MNTSAEGIALIKKFEGCELKAYQCSAGVWTIGYGHTKDVEEGDTRHGQNRCQDTQDNTHVTVPELLSLWRQA